MGLIVHLVAKDLKRKLRSPLGLLAAMSFPLLFAGMLALAFGKGDGIPKVKMLVANEDEGLLGDFVASAFTSKQAAGTFDARAVTREAGVREIGDGEASALLTIPKGFTGDVLDSKPTTLTLLKNPSEGILPEIAVQTTGTIADVLDAGRRVLDGPITDLKPLLTDRGGIPADADIVAISLGVKRVLSEVWGIVNPPAIALESTMFETKEPGKTTGDGGDGSGAIFLIVLPGIAVYGLFLVAEQGMHDVMTERTQGTLRRQLAGPVRPETLIVAKAVFTAVLAAGATLVMACAGALVLRKAVSLPGFLLVASAVVLAVTGTTAAIFGLCRTERQAATIANIIFLLMGFMAGGFIRIEALPPALRAIAPLTPLYWGTKGFRSVLEDGAGVAGVIQPVAILAVMGTVLLIVGAAALRRATRTGARG